MSEMWMKEYCQKCKAVNWLNDGDVNDVTVTSIEAIQCWKCGHRWWTGEELGEEECASLIAVEVEELPTLLAADPKDQPFNMVVGLERPK